MQDSFDKKLAERIVQVFDEYEDDSVDQGWEQLRQKYPVSRSRSPIVYWLGSAAAILLLIAGVWLFYPKTEKVQLASQDKSLQPDKTYDNTAPQAIENDSGNVEQQNAISGNLSADATYASKKVDFIPEKSREVEKLSLAVSYTVEPTLDTIVSPSLTQTPVLASAEPELNTKERSPAIPAEVKRSMPTSTLESYDELQQAKRDLLANESLERKEKNKNSKLSFSLYAGSHVSYAEGSKSRVNTGIGVSSELGLTSKLKLTTGVSLAQNSLRYDTRIPQQAAASFLNSAMSTSQNLMVASPDAKTSAINYSINGYDASLLGLDVPVNLKYTFFEKKNELYLVAGVSSNFFFDETYTYDYGYNSIQYNSVESYPDEKTTTNASSFDFARMLNLSVGYGYPIGKQSKLSLEPFLKYPLGGLGSQDIRFSSAGLNLKWNFNSR